MPPARLCLLFLLMCTTGCSNKISAGTFSRIKPGISLQEVEAILGKGKEMTDEETMDRFKPAENATEEFRRDFEKNKMTYFQGMTGVKWESGKRTIFVLLSNERVQKKGKTGF